MDEVIDYAVASDIGILSSLYRGYQWITIDEACSLLSRRPCLMQRLTEEYENKLGLSFYTIRLYFYAPADVLEAV